jgi:hypothetical protein
MYWSRLVVAVLMVLWQCHVTLCELSCDSEGDLLAHLHYKHNLTVDPVVKRYLSHYFLVDVNMTKFALEIFESSSC